MKRKIKTEIILLVFLSISMMSVFCACSLSIFRKEYTVTCLIEDDSYKEDIIVKKGEKYKCPVPSRENYTFLYYTDEYGMIYTDDKGYSLSEFKEKKDITLIFQWKGDEILISYNMDGGKISENDYILVEYGSVIPSLLIPQKEHCKFSVWRGVDKNGISFVIHDGMRFLNPKLTITKDNFLIEDKKVILTAQYDLDTVAVTCIYEDNTVIEEM